MAVLKNVPVMWAQVQKPSSKFEPAWEVRVLLTKEQAAALKAEAKAVHPKGIKVPLNEETNMYEYKFRRKVERVGGGENQQPKIVDKFGKDFKSLIGNGSLCDVQYAFAPYNNVKFGQGVTNDLKAIKVNTLVPYGAVDGDEFEFDQSPDKGGDSSDELEYDDVPEFDED